MAGWNPMLPVFVGSICQKQQRMNRVLIAVRCPVPLLSSALASVGRQASRTIAPAPSGHSCGKGSWVGSWLNCATFNRKTLQPPRSA